MFPGYKYNNAVGGVEGGYDDFFFRLFSVFDIFPRPIGHVKTAGKFVNVGVCKRTVKGIFYYYNNNNTVFDNIINIDYTRRRVPMYFSANDRSIRRTFYRR